MNKLEIFVFCYIEIDIELWLEIILRYVNVRLKLLRWNMKVVNVKFDSDGKSMF